jgi:hypothetical protein
MRQLRPGPYRSRVFDRGAEGREEGAQGVAAEEALRGVSGWGKEVENGSIGVYVHYGQSWFRRALLGFTISGDFCVMLGCPLGS